MNKEQELIEKFINLIEIYKAEFEILKAELHKTTNSIKFSKNKNSIIINGNNSGKIINIIHKDNI